MTERAPRRLTRTRLAAPLLAGAWLVLKGLVVAWPREAAGGAERDRFNLFLAGNGLSLAFGIGAGLAAAEMAGAADASVVALGLFGPVLLAVAADAYIRWIGRERS